MGISNLFNKIKQNHGLMMVICCAIPLVILIAIYFLGISNKYIFWFVVLLCPIMHFFMMKYMDGDKKDGEDKKCH